MTHQIVIVGGGITGLSIAERLSAAGLRVVILERESRVGGLARTFEYDGWHFDIGPHRFHTHDNSINDYIHSVIPDNAQIIGRNSSVFFYNRYFQWPLRPETIFKLPMKVALSGLKDLLMRPRYQETSESFEDYVIAHYGQTLYESFFKQYTEKFAYVSCDKLHRSWATASVDRAIIDQRIKMNGLPDVIRMVLLPKCVKTKFIYPSTGGCGLFCNMLSDRIKKNGGYIYTDVSDIVFEHSNGEVKSVSAKNMNFKSDYLVWTAPLPLLCSKLAIKPPPLRFMNTVIFNVLLKKAPQRKEQWIYFSSKQIIFARVSNPAAFCIDNIPIGKGGLCVEVMCHNPDWWRNPQQLSDTVINDLERVGLCDKHDIESIYIERIPETYPIYSIDYPHQRKTTLQKLNKIENLYPTGRCGAFVYNNMDNSIQMGLDTSETILNSINR